MNRLVQELAAEALFVSDIQPSECPTHHAVEQTITAMLLCYGDDGCAAEFAAQFGDHPDTAVGRMSWARGELSRQNPPHGPVPPRDSSICPGRVNAGR